MVVPQTEIIIRKDGTEPERRVVAPFEYIIGWNGRDPFGGESGHRREVAMNVMLGVAKSEMCWV